jgi:ATP-dependent phosphofructokinase / diphosphate-dependent phosphofructokinase
MSGGEFPLGGIGEIVACEVAKRTGKQTRCCVLGHLQRGGAPTTLDRILATRFEVKAVQLANEGPVVHGELSEPSGAPRANR